MALTLPVSRAEQAKVTSIASVGTLIEYYDLQIVAVAATIGWPGLFFPASNPTLALANSLFIFVIAYLVRPFSGFLFGHIGDRYGRKQALVWTLLLMGIGMAGAALTPTYSSIGILAPALLIVWRILQGFALGGEWGGAAAWVAEFAARSKYRTFWTSWMQTVTVMGQVASAGAFVAMGLILGPDALLSIGWRILFLIGAAAVIVAGVLRTMAKESPMFEALAQKKAVEKLPALKVYKDQWKTILIWTFIAGPLQLGGATLTPLVVAWTGALHVNTVAVLGFFTISSIVAVVVTIFAGLIASFVTKNRLFMIFSFAAQLVLLYPFYLWVGSGSLTLILLALILFVAISRGGNAVLADMMTASFPTKYRVSGTNQAYQFSSIVTGLLGGFVLPSFILLYRGPVNAAPYMLAVIGAFSVVSLILSIFSLKKTEQVLT